LVTVPVIIEAGANPRGEHAKLGDGAFVLADPDKLAGAQGPRVGQDQPGRRLPDDAGGAKGNHQADQHRQAFERIGTGARQIGISHRQRKQPDCQCGQALRRLQGFMVEPAERPRRGHPAQDASGKCGHAPGDKENRQRHAQPRYRIDDALQQITSQFHQIVVEAFAPRPRIREA
jgi:hypothetical protein